MSVYTYQYENYTGPQDDCYYEYWTVEGPDGIVCEAKTEQYAILICDLLNKNIGWVGAKVQCDICAHDWVAVYHSSCDKLECPNCKNITSFEIIKK
jgi:hypothetical protein